MNMADALILGNIFTMNDTKPHAQAMTVLDGKIQYVGSEEVARSLCGRDTAVYDYRGYYVYPGLIEAHCHPVMAGQRLIGQASLGAGESIGSYLRIMSDFMKKHPGKKLYQGAGWFEAKCEKKPTAGMLDEICSDTPVILQTGDGHSMWLNHKAMETFAVDKTMAAKYGPDLVRIDENGEPTGYISEQPVMDVMAQLSMTKEEIKSYIKAWEDFAVANGYTACVSAGLELETKGTPEAYAELQEGSELRLTTFGYSIVKDNAPDPEGEAGRIAAMAKELNGEKFKVVGAKIFLDGVIEAHTGWMLDGYKDQPGYYGLKRFTDSEILCRLIKSLGQKGLSIHAHTIGDGAVKFYVDAVCRSQTEIQNMDMRNVAAHLQIVRPEEIKKFGDYNIVPAAGMMWPGKGSKFYQQEAASIGEEAAEHAYPVQSFMKAGAAVVNHSDYPVSTSIGAPHTFYAAQCRTSPDGEPQDMEEAISRKETLASMTTNAAYMLREENRRGVLKEGYTADLSVFDKDLMNDSIEEIYNASCVATIIGGREVYRNESYRKEHHVI